MFIKEMLKRLISLNLGMKVDMSFEKINDCWYVDYPEYPFAHANLQMVQGADEICEFLSQGEGYFTIQLSIKRDLNHKPYLTLVRDDENSNSYGRVYDVGGFKAWLCPVMRYTFGYYPKNIYLYTK